MTVTLIGAIVKYSKYDVFDVLRRLLVIAIENCFRMSKASGHSNIMC